MHERRTVTMDADELAKVLRTAVHDGCQDFVKDKAVQAELGEAFYNAFILHGTKDTKLWIGGKILAALGIVLLSAGMTLYIKYGGGK